MTGDTTNVVCVCFIAPHIFFANMSDEECVVDVTRWLCWLVGTRLLAALISRALDCREYIAEDCWPCACTIYSVRSINHCRIGRINNRHVDSNWDRDVDVFGLWCAVFVCVRLIMIASALWLSYCVQCVLCLWCCCGCCCCCCLWPQVRWPDELILILLWWFVRAWVDVDGATALMLTGAASFHVRHDTTTTVHGWNELLRGRVGHYIGELIGSIGCEWCWLIPNLEVVFQTYFHKIYGSYR